MTVFQRVVMTAKDIPAAERSPSIAMGLLWPGFSDCQKPTVRVSSLTVKRREFQWVSSGAESSVAASLSG